MSQSPLRLILASQSPRRRELAIAAGWDIVVQPPPEAAEQTALPRQPAEDFAAFVIRLARTKAAAVASVTPPGDRAILACDTLGDLDNEPLGKPVDAADARRMITAIAGRTHRVLTGVSLWLPHAAAPTGWKIRDAYAESSIFMDQIPEHAIETYLATGAWRGKAGSCGLQDDLLPLRLIDGTADTVVGLPVALIESLARTRTS